MRGTRNIAIIAHVDHGKTTLVDCLLRECGMLARGSEGDERIMDRNDQEKERGITIFSKQCSLRWDDWQINMIDTPGHADFGGEVERIMTMVDAVLLVVDAVEGPMPQTRFVTMKAFEKGLQPVLIVNKVDREGARPHQVIDEVFDLFASLDATEEQLDFPVVFASAIRNLSGSDPDVLLEGMSTVLEAIVKYVPEPDVQSGAEPFQMQVCSLEWSSYVGVLGIGRVRRGKVARNQLVSVVGMDGKRREGRIMQVFGYAGLEKEERQTAEAGDIICISGVENLQIGDTLCDPAHPEALPPIHIDQPTVRMTFQVNNSPFASREGKYVTSSKISERLQQEAVHNVALRVSPGDSPDRFLVAGRGELHLSVLIETMRREGFEFGVSPPEVICREIDGELCEPFENLVLDIEEDCQGSVIEELGRRKADMSDMQPAGSGRIRITFVVPARGLIGFRSRFLTLTRGTGIMSHAFAHYGPQRAGIIRRRQNGVLISMATGKAPAYALFNLQERGRMLIPANTEVYEGMIIGIHSRDNDLVVNPIKGKQLTNVRASGKDDAVTLSPHVDMSLEQAMEFIADDELLEVTPISLRIRKQLLTENERKRASRTTQAAD